MGRVSHADTRSSAISLRTRVDLVSKVSEFDFLKFVKTAKVKFEFRVNKLSFTDHLYGVGKPLIWSTYKCKDIC